jgi:ABC-2 type transport system permease protein
MAWITIGVFLLAMGLLLWFFPDTSILDYGYAELNGFFSLVPFLFMFLIPAVTMRSFAEERREGTYVLLASRPLTEWQIVLGKYLASLVVIVLALLPTLIYWYSIHVLSLPGGNVDSGAIIGSYVGLLFLSAAFTAAGIFASALTSSQVVAFATSVLICFLAFSGLEQASGVFALQSVESVLLSLSFNTHYQSMSRGVLDTRDLVYFLTVILFFLGFTKMLIERRRW